MSDKDHINRAYMRKALDADLLEAEHEFELARRWKEEQDESALHELTSAYMRLAISIAKKFKTYGLPFADLVQEGNIGLMKAAARFEPEREIRFSTYATWWIHSSIQDYVLRNWSIVRAGTTVAHKSLFFSLRRLRAQIQDFDEQPSAAARTWIAQQLNVREVDVDHMTARLSGADRSLNMPVGEGGQTQWEDFLEDESDTPELKVMAELDGRIRSDLISQALNILDERERHIIYSRRLSEDGETLQSIGERIGVSKERVRQIEAQALAKLREELERLTGGDVQRFGLID